MFPITSSAIYGIRAIPVSIETDISAGLPQFTIVGLPDASVRESRDRIRSAIKNSGLPFPRGRVTVNLHQHIFANKARFMIYQSRYQFLYNLGNLNRR